MINRKEAGTWCWTRIVISFPFEILKCQHLFFIWIWDKILKFHFFPPHMAGILKNSDLEYWNSADKLNILKFDILTSPKLKCFLSLCQNYFGEAWHEILCPYSGPTVVSEIWCTLWSRMDKIFQKPPRLDLNWILSETGNVTEITPFPHSVSSWLCLHSPHKRDTSVFFLNNFLSFYLYHHDPALTEEHKRTSIERKIWLKRQ